MELIIRDKTYPLKANFAFLNAIEKTYTQKVDGGMLVDVGLAKAIAGMQEAGDIRCLVDILLALNSSQNPRLSKAELESWLEEDCEDVEALCAEVIGFLSRANVCRMRLKKLGLIKDEPQTVQA